MKNYKRLLQYMRPYVKQLILAIFCIIMAAAANLYLPWIIKDMIDKVLAEKDMLMLNLICVGIVVVFLLRGIFFTASRISSLLSARRSSSMCVKSCSANSSACRWPTLTAIRRARS